MSASTGRRHRILPHTADAGLQATAPTPEAALEEAALALGQLGWQAAGGSPLTEPIEIEAADLVGVAYAWLNELLAVAATSAAALAGGSVEHLRRVPNGWRLSGHARLVPLHRPDANVLRDIKSVTFHRLALEEHGAGWRLTAYVDL